MKVKLLIGLLIDLGSIWGAFREHFWSILGSKIGQKSSKNSDQQLMQVLINFLIDFWRPFGIILAPLSHRFSIQNRFQGENGDFLKVSVSLKRELHFRGSRASKSPLNASRNRPKKRCVF